MKKALRILILWLLISGTHHFASSAQEALKPRPSPLEMVTLKYEDTYVKVTYCRPHKRGRNIFGDLVPYGEIWRTGANEATELTITGNISMAGHAIKPGTYTLFTIPHEDRWTIVLNSELGQWGAYNYNEKFDVLRFEVPVNQVENTYEPFTMEFEQKAQSAELVMMWDQIRVSIPLEFM